MRLINPTITDQLISGAVIAALGLTCIVVLYAAAAMTMDFIVWIKTLRRRWIMRKRGW